ncbi:MAG: endonuclease/exonuclease/phosphatase family protein, partial [Chitinophagales bacterium]
MKWYNKIFFVLTIICTGLLLMSYASMYISPQTIWFSPFFGLAYLPILSVFILFLFYWLRVQTRVFIFLAAILLLGFTAHRSSFAMHWPNGAKPSEEDITLLTFNVRGFDELSKEKSLAHQQAIINGIIAADADIICLQEFTSYHNIKKTIDAYQELKKNSGLPYEYYYKVFENNKSTRSYGLLILSKFPVIDTGRISYNALSKANSTIFADIQIHNQVVRLLTAHLQSNQLDAVDLEIVESPNVNAIKDYDSKRVISKLKTSYSLRAGQAEAIAAERDKSPYPVIICGDFNDTPVSFAYRQISENMQDAFLSRGFGLGATYKPFPFIRI